MALQYSKKNRLVAKVVETDYGACAFCKRTVNDEIGYGKLYSIGEIYCHYFCVLLSCCLVQKGNDEEGLLGFLYRDILAEVERSKKHKCSFCGLEGATLGCSLSQCRRQFHLPCGRERNTLSMFYGNYKSYCEKHAPRQNIEKSIMEQAKLRMSADRRKGTIVKLSDDDSQDATVCVICYESVPGYPSTQTFWPPCCARDAWFHRNCLERMALSAGAHYLKCPLCNDKENFHRAVVSQGYYVPDRDASWELDNAFRDMYEREVVCRAAECVCPRGRSHDEENGPWDIKLCLLCGGGGCHTACQQGDVTHLCNDCLPAAPADITGLQERIAAVIKQEEARATQIRRGPIMPSRMSLRRTKPRTHCEPGTSTNRRPNVIEPTSQATNNLKTIRLEFNLKSPKKQTSSLIDPSMLKHLDNKLLSPIKMLEERLYEQSTVRKVDCAKVIDMMRTKFKKPRPLCKKKTIINAILNEILKESPKARSPLKEWHSPKKTDGNKENCMQISTELTPLANNPTVTELISNTNLGMNPKKSITNPTTPQKTANLTGIPQKNHIKLELPQKCITNLEKTPQKFNIKIPSTPEKSNLIDLQKTPIKYIEESSNSTFELPSEFVAEIHSDDSLPPFNTPKKSKIIEIAKNSSMEISEGDQQINIDVNKMTDIKPENCIKFSPMNKDDLGKQKKLDIDMECFKKHYLSEVNKDYQCGFKHKHENESMNTSSLYNSTIQYAIKAATQSDSLKEIAETDRKSLKRMRKNKKKKIKAMKLAMQDGPKKIEETDRKSLKRKLKNKKKKLKDDKYVFEYEKRDDSVKIKLTYNQAQKQADTIDLSIASETTKRNLKNKINKSKTNHPIRNNVKLKIKWKAETDTVKKNKKPTKKVVTPEGAFKQTLLQFQNSTSPKEVLVSPNSVTPMKKKNGRQEKQADGYKQTSLHSFFKMKSP